VKLSAWFLKSCVFVDFLHALHKFVSNDRRVNKNMDT
jgi:hypothetical protein